MADLETKNSAVATEESGERKVKMRSLALDLVPMGSDEENRMADLKVTKTLPEGIESKMLYSDIIHIAWPSLVELTLTQLASMVDLMMVGQLGPWALTAVGLTTPAQIPAHDHVHGDECGCYCHGRPVQGRRQSEKSR